MSMRWARPWVFQPRRPHSSATASRAAVLDFDQRKHQRSVTPQIRSRNFLHGRPRPPVSKGAFMNSTLPTSSTPLPPRVRSNNSATICFRRRVSSFAPTGNVPVGDDYIVGPDDELNVYNWGRVNQTIKLKVDRDGAVMVQDIGPIQVGGSDLRAGQETHRRPDEPDHRR